MHLKILALVATMALTPSAQALSRYVEGQVLVKFRDRTSETTRRRALQLRGHSAKNLSHDEDLVAVKVAAGESVDEAVAAYAGDPDVEYAQPNFLYHLHKAPNDPMYGQLWALENKG